MINGFFHVSFTVSNLEAAVKWYTEVLGLEYVRGQEQHNEYTAKLVGYPGAHLKVAQLRVPGHLLGRVASINQIFVGSSNEIGAFESGVAARLLGVIPSVVFGGAMTLLVTGVTSLRSPELRQLGPLDQVGK